MRIADGPLQEVVDRLIAHGLRQAAEDFAVQISKLASADATERSTAAEAIIYRCHVRWLGDLYLEALSLQEWWGLLDRAADHAKKVSGTQ